ncbi:MAG TPA: NAD(P)/FAD-dependent oxidoreductase [Acidimicrobiales bacterium]|nr:NAD(P)/FAD-dependent oxidoreductase [Acidimicrobiales bacterium]
MALTVDAVVVGGGPAGLSAAVWLARYRRTVAVIDSEEYRNRWVDASHGYLGYDGWAPAEFLARARADLDAYPGTEHIVGHVEWAKAAPGGGFAVGLADGRELEARRLVLATGVVDRFPDIENFFDHYGADAFTCPTCDGYESRDREVVALGWTAEIAGFARHLDGWARSVTVVTDGHRYEGDEDDRAALGALGIEVVEEGARSLEGPRGGLRGVRLDGGRLLPCDRVFFAIGIDQRTELAVRLGCELTGEGCLRVGDDSSTSVEGVWAAGDITPGPHLVQVAAAKGAVAGVACARSLLGV